ncbi:MAG: 5'-methylthioadenosine/adenosylhomocysteine nucleosidase [Eubacteriales bacterium]|nr:5'-methylthioadenosine/adenosylhomocysteine nucleosidase [Eubacteriales bacterium]
MNKIGIIGAMEQEISLLKEKMEEVCITTRASMEFYEGRLHGKQVVVVRSGIGKVNAGVCAQILVDVFGVEAMINTGIAGSLKNEINIGDIVLSTDVVQHDMDASGFGYPLGQIPQMDAFSFEADAHLADLAERVCKRVNPEIQVFRGRVASGDQFISSRSVKEEIKKNFQGFCVEMEGAAIGQTAYLNGIPFLIIRAISDKADDSASVAYETFEKQAILHSVNLTENMLKEL